MQPNDLELLERYLRDRSEEAFAQLVGRHLDLVYSAALRQVRSSHFAEEVAQSVFTDLSRNAARLISSKTHSLTAWLYQVTRHTAVDVIRREVRRQAREKLAVELIDMQNQPSVWKEIEPLLEEAMDTLDPCERSAILLRFFENKSLREVGQTLGTSEDAAQKRVSRAVERLRQFFTNQGVAVGASTLVAVLSAHAVQSAPLGLGATISTVAVSSTAVNTLTIAGVAKSIAMTTMQKVLIGAVLTAGLGATLYEAHRAGQWQAQARALAQQQEPLSDQLRQLQREHEQAAAQLASLRNENEDLRHSAADLPRLRGEMARMRDSARELAQLKAAAAISGNDPDLDSAAKTWAARASRLRQRLDKTSAQQIPELQLLKEKDWFDAVKGMNQLDTDDDYQRGFSNARNIAKGAFGRMLQAALRGYTDANNGQLPQDLSQLKPFFETPVDDSVLARYRLLRTGKLSDGSPDEYLVAESAPLIDEEHDATYKFSLNGTNSHSGGPTEDAVKESVVQYAQAHNDMLPPSPADLAPYLKTPVDPAKLQALFNRIPSGVTTLRQLKAAMQ